MCVIKTKQKKTYLEAKSKSRAGYRPKPKTSKFLDNNWFHKKRKKEKKKGIVHFFPTSKNVPKYWVNRN